ncbi:hypothetical protein BUALT_Bualt14G0105100 [Buddleja alternifolia]|uniref:Uncharacterized protein n=1 Tax=Buddleja alternifolia TaxID=168488 RepID=A0AAV6WN61_9LAMI|nr:hypothetical protein BUALT_Bualt14G0105100 [Buddleja alternifolia]
MLVVAVARVTVVLSMAGIETDLWGQTGVAMAVGMADQSGYGEVMNFPAYAVLTFLCDQSSACFAGCVITCKGGSEELYDGCIIAAPAPDALKMLGTQATYDELRILGAFQYAHG